MAVTFGSGERDVETSVTILGGEFGSGDTLRDMWTRPDPERVEVYEIFDYALTVDGYFYAQAVLHSDLRKDAPRLLRKWRGPGRAAMRFVELRLLLFWRQRAAHHLWQGGSVRKRSADGSEEWVPLKSGPDEDDARDLRELNQAICAAWQQERPDKEIRVRELGGVEQDEFIAAICEDVDVMLMASHDLSHGRVASAGSRLLFPMKRGARRVSEQEVRFLFAHAIEAVAEPGELYYAVEVPTEKKYHFSSDGVRSASTDLSLYRASDLDHPCLNVEFKAKGRSANRLVDRVVRKDIAKLLAEPCDGLWYHLLKNANSATVRSLVELFNEALVELAGGRLADFTSAPVQAKRITFHICVLEQRLSLHCAIDVAPDGSGAALTVPTCSVQQGALSIDEAGAWRVQRAAAAAAEARRP